MSQVPNPPRSTVRLQLSGGFTLDDARATVPYHAALGISHFYLSPLLAARAGSSHGYDVIDPGRIDPARGDIDSLRLLVAQLRANGMGLILDIVPNHMAASIENPWWRDLLEWGQASRYQGHFDIDWEPPDPELRGRVLLPTLERPTGELIADGDAGLEFDPGDGRIHLVVATQRFPLAASMYGHVLDCPALATSMTALAVAADAEGLERALASVREHARTPQASADIQARLATFRPDSAAGRERFERLLAAQPYLLVPWTQAWQRINWRRFFDINDLVAIRPDRPEVFEDVHGLVLDLYAQGLIDGLRIDHIDGLIDPARYCKRLREALTGLEGRRPPEAPQGPAYLIVEKILAADEVLRHDWPVDGTTGYEFMDQVSAVLHDPSGLEPLDRLWRHVPGARSFTELALAARRQMVQENFAADLDACVRALQQLARAAPEAIPERDLRMALIELIVHFPVYRSYAKAGTVDPVDAGILASAARDAVAALPRCDASALALVQRWLSGDTPASAPDRATQAIQRVQRLTPPVSAKAIEDTTFYRFGRLLSRNEVGAEPDHFALSVDDFHAACARRARETPDTLLATATHDHKRGEDTRARLAVLSEVPDVWAAHMETWQAMNAAACSMVDGAPAPARIDEAMLYQSLAGAWPAMSGAQPPAEALQAFADRMSQWQCKALREAKCRSGWSRPNQAYEAACERFLRACLVPGAEFVASMSAFVGSIAPAGAVNGLAQTLLRLTTPGVPDLYQGTGFWDFSLVDPDNRSPVDYTARQSALADAASFSTLIDTWPDGRVKQAMIARVLAARKAQPLLFSRGTYRPMIPQGARAGNAIVFVREHGANAAIVVAPRLPWRLLGADAHGDPRIPSHCWQDTTLDVSGQWHDVVADRSRRFHRTTMLGGILDQAPVALLLR